GYDLIGVHIFCWHRDYRACQDIKFIVSHSYSVFYYNISRGSTILPVSATAATVKGLARRVLEPGPCRPSKFLLEVETAYFPEGILSSFIARQAEQPGCRSLNPASSKISTKPSSIAFFSTCLD